MIRILSININKAKLSLQNKLGRGGGASPSGNYGRYAFASGQGKHLCVVKMRSPIQRTLNFRTCDLRTLIMRTSVLRTLQLRTLYMHTLSVAHLFFAHT